MVVIGDFLYLFGGNNDEWNLEFDGHMHKLDLCALAGCCVPSCSCSCSPFACVEPLCGS